MSSTVTSTMAAVTSNGRTPETDLIVGIAMIVLSVICALAYSFILTTIYRDKELIRMTSYKFMFVLGVVDVVQCFPHAVTGFMTIYQSRGSYAIAKTMGVLATPFYVAYAVMTVVLAAHRFTQLFSPGLEIVFFSPRAALYWIAFVFGWCLLYMLALASPWAAIIYNPDWYSWDYDYSLPASYYVQKVEMVIEVGGIFVSGFLYLGVIIMLMRTRKRFAASRNYTTEVKILIQALTITIYCSILNIFWHNYKVLLPDDLWTYCGLNFMWIFNSGVYPVVYFIVNSAIRNKLISKASRTGGGKSAIGHSVMLNTQTRTTVATAAPSVF